MFNHTYQVVTHVVKFVKEKFDIILKHEIRTVDHDDLIEVGKGEVVERSNVEQISSIFILSIVHSITILLQYIYKSLMLLNNTRNIHIACLDDWHSSYSAPPP